MYYLDLVIDACSYPLERIEERTKRIRPVGLGIMGLADAAILLGMRYGSPRFSEFCKCLGDSMGSAALCAAAGIVSDMGKEPFPEAVLVEELFSKFAGEQGEELFPESWYGRLDRDGYRSLLEKMRSSATIPYTLSNALEGFFTAQGLGDEGARLELAGSVLLAFAKGRIRNSRRLSVAPTGSISMLIDTSAGIEPNFAWSWTRRIARADGEGQETREFCHKLLSPSQVDELHEKGALSDPVFVTAYDIPPDEHVEVTGIFARVVDSGISKTVNLPSGATVDEVKQIYRRCYAMGAKGITIYRDGSRSFQPIETAKKPEEQVPHTSRVKERPGLVVFGKTIKEQTPWGSIYVTLNFDGTEPFEVFATIGKSGSELKAMTEALSRAISIGLRSGGKLEDFIATLKGLSGKEYWLFEFDDKHVARSIPDAIAVLLEKLIGKDGDVHGAEGGVACPECGAPMEMISGCEYCFSCGYSPCK
jgi:ribonucleoside-diphosphate reductase alpha chain